MRLFLALELPEEVRSGLRAAGEKMRRDHAGWRWVRPQSIHLTLRFLGEVEPAESDLQTERWRRTASACRGGTFRVAGSGVFPPRGRPRVLWAGILDPDPAEFLTDLASALEQEARRLGFKPEKRRFRPHLTLARAARGGGRPSVPDPGTLGDLGTVDADELVLFRSELRPEGARYTVLERFPLAAGAGVRR
jgi:2'-5' RNA ligase